MSDLLDPVELWREVDFLSAGRLWFLLVPLALAGAYVVVQTRRHEYAVRFTNLELLDSVAPDRPGWRRHLPAVLVVLALAAIVTSFARPSVTEAVAREEAVVVLAIDVSLSMDATDVAPTRLAAAQAAAQAFLDEVPQGVRVGLVTFAGTAGTVVPPTSEIALVRRAVDGLTLDEATAIGEAVFASLAAIEQSGALPEPRDGDGGSGDGSSNGRDGDAAADAGSGAAVVLLSDGDTNQGRTEEEAAAAAADLGVPVSTVAFGTDTGTLALPDGQVVPVPVDRAALEALAEGTGGQFASAETAAELTSIYEDLGRRVVEADEEQREVGDQFAGLALLLGTLALGASLVWFGRLP